MRKKILALILCIAMTCSSMSVQAFANPVQGEHDVYQIGDIEDAENSDVLNAEEMHFNEKEKWCFGMYPQDLVTDSSLISELNQQSLDADNTVMYSGKKYMKSSNQWFEYKPIVWREVAQVGEYSELISDKIIDGHVFHGSWTKTTYETSDIRKWLNNTFYNRAFSEVERSGMSLMSVWNNYGNHTNDYVALPSVDEYEKQAWGFYGNEDRIATATSFVTSTKHQVPSDYYYFTRYTNSIGMQYCYAVDSFKGSFQSTMIPDYDYGIRPLIMVKTSMLKKEEDLAEGGGSSNSDISQQERDTTERNVIINYTGRAYGYFYLCDAAGNPLKNTEFSYSIIEKSANGKNNIYQYDNRMTDADGGYNFAPPITYEYENGANNNYSYSIKIDSVQNKEPELLHDSFTVNVTVKNLSYTETWTFGLTSSLSHDLFQDHSGEMSASLGGTGTISLKHNADYTKDLTLTLKLPATGTGAYKQKEKLEDSTVSFIKTKGSASLTTYKSYSTTIENFDPLNKEQREILAGYLFIMFNESAANNVLIKQIANMLTIDDVFLTYFEHSENGQDFKLSANSTAANFDVTTETSNPMVNVGLFDSIKLGSGSSDRTYSYSVSDENGVITYKSGLKTESGFTSFSGMFGNMLGYQGLGAWRKLNDVSLSASQDAVSLSVCNYDSGLQDVLSDEDNLYRKYSAEGDVAKDLRSKNDFIRKLSVGIWGPITPENMSDTLGIFDSINASIPYTDKIKDKSNISWSPSLQITDGNKKKPKTLFTIGFKYQMSRTGETEVGNGYSIAGKCYEASDSSTTLNTIFENERQTELNDIFNYALLGMTEIIGDSFVSTAGTIKDGIVNGAAAIVSKVTSNLNWNVSITRKKETQAKSRMMEDSVFVATALNSQIGDEEEYDEAVTVGDAYYICVEDENMNTITDFAENPLELKLSYTEEELATSGIGTDAEKNLAVYYYDEENDVLVHVGGTVNTATNTVETTIVKSGEYVLCIDGARPEVTDWEVSDSSDKPTLSARINDFSDIRSLTVSLDDQVIVDDSTMNNYYDKRNHLFSYKVEKSLSEGVHTIVFTIIDSAGNRSQDSEYSFYVGKNPTIQSIIVPDSVKLMDTSEIQMKVKAVSNNGSNVDGVYAKIVVNEKDGSIYENDANLSLDNGEWSGKINIDKNVSSYDIVFIVVDEDGSRTFSDKYSCKVVCDHKWSEWTTVDEPSSTKPGEKQRVCENCNEIEKMEIPKLVTTVGWINENEKWQYCHNDGSLATNGWEKINNVWYLFDEDGWMLTGWQNINGVWYYLHSNGAMATGWLASGGKWYYLHSNGAMATGWLGRGGVWYYLHSNGAMATGWLSKGGKWYYLHSNGAMATGWVKSGGKWYYMNSSGAMVTGWQKINGKWYYMYSDGHMASKTWIGNYYVNSNGVWAKSR